MSLKSRNTNILSSLVPHETNVIAQVELSQLMDTSGLDKGINLIYRMLNQKNDRAAQIHLKNVVI